MWAGGDLWRERRVLDDESIEESWNQVNFMVMSYDAVRRQPIVKLEVLRLRGFQRTQPVNFGSDHISSQAF